MGVAINSDAINKAIDAAAAEGGGTVYFPAGNYLSGSIHLKSNICLYIDQGATLIAASDSAEFDQPEKSVNDAYQDYGHSHWHNSFIWGEKLHDVSIIGTGTIWEKGWFEAAGRGWQTQQSDLPFALPKCYYQEIFPFYMEDGLPYLLPASIILLFDNLKVDTNRDGFDIDCCKNVRVSNCYGQFTI